MAVRLGHENIVHIPSNCLSSTSERQSKYVSFIVLNSSTILQVGLKIVPDIQMSTFYQILIPISRSARSSTSLYWSQQANFAYMALPFSHININTFHTLVGLSFFVRLIWALFGVSKFEDLWRSTFIELSENSFFDNFNNLRSNLALLSSLTVLLPTNFNQKQQLLL